MPVNFEEADKAIRSAAKVEAGSHNRNMMTGWFGAALKEEDSWNEHGFANEAAYRDAVGVSKNVWGRYVRIASGFLRLPVEDFSKMSAENAEALGSLPIDKRNDFTWVFNAITMKAEEFKKLVLEAKAAAAGVEPKDMRVKFSLPLFEAQRAVIKSGIKEFAREHQIKDEGTALEWLVLEYSERNTFRRFIQEQVPKLRLAFESSDPDHYHLALGMHLVALNKMLENLKG